MLRRDLLLGALVLAWPRRTSANQPALQSTLAQWESDPHHDLKGVVVLLRGVLVAEHYYNGDTPTSLHDIRSAGKSITSLLMGIAIDKKLIRGVTDNVQRYLPQTKGSAIGDVTLDELLTMRSGLAANDDIPGLPGNEDKFNQAADPVSFLTHILRASPPGSAYAYNSMNAYTAGLIIGSAAKQDEADFAREHLFQPLGISQFHWAKDGLGHTKGQGNLSFSTRDFAKIGQMVLNQGTYEDHRIVGSAWIAESLKPRVEISKFDPYADNYGYFWYSRTHSIKGAQIFVHFASGNGGNKIYIVPSRDMVVAITSSAYGHGYGQRRSQDILLALLNV
jgi:CubicO group peptidase (beta-lactamase class C family)